MRVFVAGYDGLPGDLYTHAAEVLAQRGFVNPPGVYYHPGRLNGELVTIPGCFLAEGSLAFIIRQRFHRHDDME